MTRNLVARGVGERKRVRQRGGMMRVKLEIGTNAERARKAVVGVVESVEVVVEKEVGAHYMIWRG